MHADDRQKLIDEKSETDVRLRDARRALGMARSNGARGKYMDRGEFAQLELKVNTLMNRSQEIQKILGSTRVRELSFPQMFMKVAEDILSEDMYDRLIQAALAERKAKP